MSMAEDCSLLDPCMHRTESAWVNKALTRVFQTSLSDTSSSVSHDTLSSSCCTPVLLPRYQVSTPLGDMVQRVTGVRLDGDLAEPLVKPEPVRPAVVGARAVLQQTHLPTLDTSAFLLERDEGSSLGPAADVPASDFDGLLPAFSSLGSWSVM
ncbi:hypothetical protein GW17_00005294 [Ensete ventricosum]|nr:hypothetical protein GW17_00005294 [Ensete ventricosum]